MFNVAMCPSCNSKIMNVHFEEFQPSSLKGGSFSYVAVATPCGHALSAIPMIWENTINKTKQNIENQSKDIKNIEYQISNIQSILDQLVRKIR